jgi:hypothetical protein
MALQSGSKGGCLTNKASNSHRHLSQKRDIYSSAQSLTLISG